MTPIKFFSSREEKFLNIVVVRLYLTAIWWDESSQVLEVVYILQWPKKAVLKTYKTMGSGTIIVFKTNSDFEIVLNS